MDAIRKAYQQLFRNETFYMITIGAEIISLMYSLRDDMFAQDDKRQVLSLVIDATLVANPMMSRDVLDLAVMMAKLYNDFREEIDEMFSEKHMMYITQEDLYTIAMDYFAGKISKEEIEKKFDGYIKQGQSRFDEQ